MDPNKQLFDIFASTLRESGLGELFTIDADGNPGGWLWNQIQSGVDSYEAFASAFQATDVFRNRFAVIVEQQRRAAKGEAVYVMSPQDVLNYEREARSIMADAGIPSWMYDEPDDFNEYILRNISTSEIRARVDQTFEYIDNAPAEVRQAFNEYYGVGQGRAALAAFVLDPERTSARLEKARQTAFAGGMAKRFEIDMNKTRAEQIVELGLSDVAITNTYAELNRRAGLFRDSRFEDDQISLGQEGVDSEFFGDTAATVAINRRLIGRQAMNSSATGGAVATQQGIAGAGTAGGR